MINIEDVVITQPILCAVAAIDEFRGRRTGMEQTDDPLAAQLTEKALNDSVAAIADNGERNSYRRLLEQINSRFEEISFFENTVKRLHKTLLADSLVSEQEKGEYKQRLNPVYSKTVDGRPIDVFDSPVYGSFFDYPPVSGRQQQIGAGSRHAVTAQVRIRLPAICISGSNDRRK